MYGAQNKKKMEWLALGLDPRAFRNGQLNKDGEVGKFLSSLCDNEERSPKKQRTNSQQLTTVWQTSSPKQRDIDQFKLFQDSAPPEMVHVMDWWRQNYEQFPRLANLGQDIFFFLGLN